MANYSMQCTRCEETFETDVLDELLAWNREHDRVCPERTAADRSEDMNAADAAFKKRDEHATWSDERDRDAAVRWHWRGFQDGAELARREARSEPTFEETRELLREAMRGAGEGEVFSERMSGILARALRPERGESEPEVFLRGTFGHVWPCPLFYVGNWKRGEEHYEPVVECVNPNLCEPQESGA